MELFHAEDLSLVVGNQICTETGHSALVEVDKAACFMCHTTAKALTVQGKVGLYFLNTKVREGKERGLLQQDKIR